MTTPVLPVRGSGHGGTQVQELLRDLGLSVVWSVALTRGLLESRSIGEAKEVVLNSAARTDEAAIHTRLIAELERELEREIAEGRISVEIRPSDDPTA
jgi:hypothetical protein